MRQRLTIILILKPSEIDLVKFADGEALAIMPEACVRGSVVLIQRYQFRLTTLKHTAVALEALACANNIILMIS